MPNMAGRVIPADFKALRVKAPDRALASLSLMAKINRVITTEMLYDALNHRFAGDVLSAAIELVKRTISGP